MKKNILTCLVLSLVTFAFTQSTYAQGYGSGSDYGLFP